ncbi:kinase-like domain-containing protein, partial [Boletus edulis]
IAYGFGMDGAMSLVSLWMANESLHRFLAKYDNNLAMVHRLQFLLDIANGLHYLHSLPIVHGDLNCNNVLLDADYTARLTDFGYASLVGNIPEALAYLQRSTARPGALRWSAPEQILSEEVDNRTTKSDMYSFGCVALQLLSGKQPWSEIHADGAVVLRLAKGHKPRRPESRLIDDSHWNLIQECWLPMEDRPAAEAVKSAIQQFLSHCPHSPSLYDLLPSSSNQADLGVKLPSSLSKAPMESSSAPFSPATNNENDQHSIALLSDTMRFYPPHGNEQHHTSLTGKRLVSRERTVKPDEERSLKKRRV